MGIGGKQRKVKNENKSIIDPKEKKFDSIICNINNQGINGIGFLCKIPSESNELVPVLITNSNLLPESDITSGKKIEFKLNDVSHNLTIDESRKVFNNQNDYNITIIEIKKEDKLDTNSFLEIEIDQNLKLEEYKKKKISLLIKSQKDNIELKSCKITNLGEKEYEIEYSCDIKEEVYGSPLININTNKIIGIHKKLLVMNNICQGTLLNFDKKEFFITKDKKKNNEDYELKADEKLTAKKTIKESIRSSKSLEKGMNIDILLIYLLPYNQRYVRIFGADFVKKNKDKCYFMLYDSVKNLVYDYDLCDVIEILAIPSIKYNSETFQVFLVQTDYFTDLSFMFAGCDYFYVQMKFQN